MKVILTVLGLLLVVSCSDHRAKMLSADDSTEFYGVKITDQEEKQLLGNSTLYFDFDRTAVVPDDLMVVFAHARKLINQPSAKILITGHTDERGSAGYNVSLGENRAKSIRDLLILKGVDSSQITTVSYGKDQPVSYGHDELSWSKNRRAELVYE